MRDASAPLSGSAVAFAALVLLATAFSACSDQPSESNAILSPGALKNYVFRDTTVVADTDVTFRHYIPMNGRINLIGQYGGYTAISLIQFTPAYFPTRDTAAVYSATLRLKTLTWFGDSSGTLSFNVYRVNLAWSSTTVTWDSLQLAGLYDASSVKGTWSGGAAPDTQWISIPLDTAMVRQWIASYTTAGDTKYGIILVPNPGSTIVRGYSEYSSDTSLTPTLQIIAGSVTGPERDTAMYTNTMDSFAGNVTLPVDPTQLYVQAGVAYRSALHFDISFIPKASLISKAELLMNEIPANSRLNRFSGTPTTIAHLMTSATDTTSFDLTNYVGGAIKSGTASTFSTDVRYLVQTWVKGPNYGVLVTATSRNDYLSTVDAEHTSFDLYTFASRRASDPSQRPRIHIVYALGNQ